MSSMFRQSSYARQITDFEDALISNELAPQENDPEKELDDMNGTPDAGTTVESNPNSFGPQRTPNSEPSGFAPRQQLQPQPPSGFAGFSQQFQQMQQQIEQQ